MQDVYYTPENFGLKFLDSLEVPIGYEFIIFAVWEREEDGAVFYQTDSGCSCPSPFEWATDGVNDLVPIHEVAVFTKTIRDWARSAYYGEGPIPHDQVDSLVRKVRRRLNKR